MRERLWSSHIGGMRHHEGDSYGGGNAWPLATLWLAIYESARDNVDEAHRLIEWAVTHSTAAALVSRTSPS
jgi:GH15 family glucan-1,4-alpha-glucosidase